MQLLNRPVTAKKGLVDSRIAVCWADDQAWCAVRLSMWRLVRWRVRRRRAAAACGGVCGDVYGGVCSGGVRRSRWRRVGCRFRASCRYCGTVIDFEPKEGKHHVVYDDQVEEWLHLTNELANPAPSLAHAMISRPHAHAPLLCLPYPVLHICTPNIPAARAVSFPPALSLSLHHPNFVNHPSESPTHAPHIPHKLSPGVPRS